MLGERCEIKLNETVARLAKQHGLQIMRSALRIYGHQAVNHVVELDAVLP